jgi:putative PIN family toxin of toxin-antitoxin system
VVKRLHASRLRTGLSTARYRNGEQQQHEHGVALCDPLYSRLYDGDMTLPRRIVYNFTRCDIICDMRFVLDTNVVVAAMRSPTGASASLLRAARQGTATLLLNVALALEYEAVCCQAEHRLASGLSAHEIGVFLDAVIALAEPVESHYLWRPQLRDSGDEMVLEAAVNGHADALITFNVRHFGTLPNTFGIDVLLPRQAVERVKR